MLVSVIKRIQSELKDRGFYKGKIDGIRGPKSVKGGLDFLSSNPKAPKGWQNWSLKRQAITVLQLCCHESGIDAGTVDGWWGPQSEFAFEALDAKRKGEQMSRWRDLEPNEKNPNRWPRQKDVTAFFGPHGERGGRTPKLRKVRCPWTLKIAWNLNQTTKSISIHEKCADSLERVLAKVAATYSGSELSALRLDHYGGSYNPRKMRGGSKWSMHSWGIAIDFDPAHNKLRDNHTQASMAASEYDPWWEAWEAEGWLSLGRARNFDWMHVQAAVL